MGRGAGWTREELSTLEKHLAEGKSAYQIAKLTGWSYSSVKHKLSAMKASTEPLERKRRSVTTEALTSAKTSLQAKPKQSCKEVAKQVGCSRSYAWKLMHHELKMRPLKQVRQPRLTEANKAKRRIFATKMLRRLRVGEGRRSFGKEPPGLQLDRIMWVDEKIFRYEPSKMGGSSSSQSAQNSRIWIDMGTAKKDVPGEFLYAPLPAKSPGLMVASGVAMDNLMPPVFVDRGVKLDAVSYQKILAESYVPSCLAIWPDGKYAFAQDNAPSHAAKSTVEWMSEHVADVLPHPPASPDLNPLDAGIWALWQSKVEQLLSEGRKCRNDTELRSLVITAHGMITRDEVNNCIKAWPRRLKACVANEGSHFEGAV